MFAVCISDVGFLPYRDKVASSQNKIVDNNFDTDGRSFINNRNSIGPRTLP